MSKISKEDISIVLDKWYETKKEISELEKKLEKYKKIVDKYFDYNDINSISDNNFVLKRKEIIKNTVSKKDLPTEIWNKYSKESKYNSYYLVLKKS
jgi:hypothetical protein